MGEYFTDQYSLLHFASGVMAYFFGINFYVWFILHLIFEIVENTKYGVYFINNYLKFWPGGKPKSDNILNSIGDQFYGMLGWIVAYYTDVFGEKFGYYRHIQNYSS